MFKRFVCVIFLLSAVSCEAPAQKTFCPLEVHPDDCARAWLRQQAPPQCVNDYLNKIGIQQRDIHTNCI